MEWEELSNGWYGAVGESGTEYYAREDRWYYVNPSGGGDSDFIPADSLADAMEEAEKMEAGIG